MAGLMRRRRRQPLRHDAVRRRPTAMARSSSSPPAAAPSPPWPPSTAPTGPTPTAGLVARPAAAISSARPAAAVPPTAARSSSWPPAAAPSPPWPPSTAPTGPTPRPAWSRDPAATSSAPRQTAGPTADGTVFELAAGSGTITTLANFNGANGANPYAGLVRPAAATSSARRGSAAGPTCGTVFELAAGGGTITTLVTFNGANGAWPGAGLMRDPRGDLFGTTVAGGASDQGTVFELSPRRGGLMAQEDDPTGRSGPAADAGRSGVHRHHG